MQTTLVLLTQIQCNIIHHKIQLQKYIGPMHTAVQH